MGKGSVAMRGVGTGRGDGDGGGAIAWRMSNEWNEWIGGCAWEKLPGGEKRMDGFASSRRPTRRLTMRYQSLFFF